MFSSKKLSNSPTTTRVKKSNEPNSLNDEPSSIIIDLFSSSKPSNIKTLSPHSTNPTNSHILENTFGTSIPVFSKPASAQPIMPKDQINKSPEFKSNVIQSPLLEIQPYEHPNLLLPSYPKKMHVFNPMKINKFPVYRTQIQHPDIPIYKSQGKLKSGKSYIPNKNEIFKVKEKVRYTML